MPNHDLIRRIVEGLQQQILSERQVSEVTCGNVTFCFWAKIHIETEPVYTGVEHRGERERYDKENFILRDFACTGAYGPEGNELPERPDIGVISSLIETDSDYESIRVASRRPA